MINIKTIIEDYKTLSQVPEGVKLQVNIGQNESKNLVYSSGSTTSGWGRVYQASMRQFNNKMGYAQADRYSVLSYISNLNDSLHSYLMDIKSKKITQTDSQMLFQIDKVLQSVLQKGIKHLQATYKDDKGTSDDIESLRERIEGEKKFISSVLQTQLEKQLVMPEPDAQSSLSFSLAQFNEENKILAPSYYAAHEGTGPTIVGKAYSVANTLMTMTKDYIYPPTADVSNVYDPGIRRMIQQLACEGSQLDSSILGTYLGIMKDQVSFHPINTFMNSSMDRFNIGEIESILMSYKQSDKQKPVCIPVVFGNESVLERKHIAVILIKDGQIRYYDSKGVVSSERYLGDGTSFNRVLQACRTIFLENEKAPIIENKTVHQYDAHRCGVFVLFYLYQSLLRNKDAFYFSNKIIPAKFLDEFRHALIEDFKQYDKVYAPKDEMENSSLETSTIWESKFTSSSKIVNDFDKNDADKTLSFSSEL